MYLKLANAPYSYLLESVVGGERFGRYSFIGLACAERIEARGRNVRRLVRDARGTDVCLESVEADPFEYARAWLKRHRVAPVPAALKFRRRAGRLLRLRERCATSSLARIGAEKPDPLGTPDMLLLVSDELAVVDNVLGKLYLVVYADTTQPDAMRAAHARLEHLRSRLAGPLPEEGFLRRQCASRAAGMHIHRSGDFWKRCGARRNTSTPAIACRCRSRSAPRAGSIRRRSRSIARCAA